MKKIAFFLSLFGIFLATTGAFTPNTYPVIDLAAYGAVGDGITNNNVPFSNAFAAAASGGKIRVPCGTYILTSTPSVTVAGGKHVDFEGSGSDCTVIAMQGSVAGPTFTYANQWSSARVANMTITTNQAGGSTCLTWTGPAIVNPNSAFASSNFIDNVTIRGDDNFTTNTHYCGVGFLENSISNININGYTYTGVAARSGTAISIAGSGTGSTYSVQVNLVNSTINGCDTGILYGDWVQGLALSQVNITNCNKGVNTVASPSGFLDELASTNSQFNTFTCGMCINDTQFSNLQLVNNLFIVESGSQGVIAEGSNFIISNNTVSSVSNSALNGINVLSSFGNGGIISDNQVSGFTGSGILVSSGSTAIVDIHGGQFGVNGNAININSAGSVEIYYPVFFSNTKDFNIGGSATIVSIYDNTLRALSAINTQVPCSSKTRGSHVTQADGNAPTYNATASSGTAAVVPLWCDGTNWTNH